MLNWNITTLIQIFSIIDLFRISRNEKLHIAICDIVSDIQQSLSDLGKNCALFFLNRIN